MRRFASSLLWGDGGSQGFGVGRPLAIDMSPMLETAVIDAQLESGRWWRSGARQAEGFVEVCPIDEVVGQAQAVAVVGVVLAAGEHHLGHAVGPMILPTRTEAPPPTKMPRWPSGSW